MIDINNYFKFLKSSFLQMVFCFGLLVLNRPDKYIGINSNAKTQIKFTPMLVLLSLLTKERVDALQLRMLVVGERVAFAHSNF